MYAGGSPPYSSCSSEDLEINDRQCMRCLLHKLEGETNEFPTRNRFTRSFSEEPENNPYQDLFPSSDEDFSQPEPGTRVLFCKALNLTSDEDDDKKGIKRTYEDRQDRRKCIPRKKRHLSEADEIEETERGKKIRPSSNCSERSNKSPKSKTSSTERPNSALKKFKPQTNRSSPLPLSQASRTLETNRGKKTSTEIVLKKEVCSRGIPNNRYRLEENEEVTIYEKTIITVTSSDDNYIIGESMPSLCKFKSETSSIQERKTSRGNAQQIKPDPFKCLGEIASKARIPSTKTVISKDRVIPMVVSNNVQVLPAIHELDDVERGLKSRITRSQTENMILTNNDVLDRRKQPRKCGSMEKASSKPKIEIRREKHDSTNSAKVSTLFPNSCMKKETVRTETSKKSVRFMIKDDTLGGGATKKSARLEKFPTESVVRTDKGNQLTNNLMAAPVVVQIHNTTLEQVRQIQGRLHVDGVDSILQRRMVHDHLISDIGSINNCGRNMFILRSLSSKPGEPISLPVPSHSLPGNIRISKSTDILKPRFLAIRQKENEPKLSEVLATEIHYTLSDLGITQNSSDKTKKQIIRSKTAPDAFFSVATEKPESKKVSLEEIKKKIRLKLVENQQKVNQNPNAMKVDEGNQSVSAIERSQVSFSTMKSRPTSCTKSPARLINGKVIGRNMVVKKGETAYDGTQKLGDILPHMRGGRGGTSSKSGRSSSLEKSNFGRKHKANTVMSEPHPKIDDTMIDAESTRAGSNMNHSLLSRPGTANPRAAVGRDMSPSEISTRSASRRRPRSHGMDEGASTHANGESPERGRVPSLSPNRPPSRKPHLSQASRQIQSELPRVDKAACAPRTPLTLQSKAQPNVKTRSTIRNHLDSRGALPEGTDDYLRRAPVPSRNAGARGPSKKQSGHPLRNKTLSEFLQERLLSTGHLPNNEKRNIQEKRKSEPAKRCR